VHLLTFGDGGTVFTRCGHRVAAARAKPSAELDDEVEIACAGA
jgi:hypothetical protein